MRGVYEKRPGEWYARWFDHLGRKRVKRCSGKEAAGHLYRRKSAEVLDVKNGLRLPEEERPKSVCFKDVLAFGMEKRKKRGLRSQASDETKERLALLWFGPRPASSITAQEIENQLEDAAEERGWAAQTFNAHRMFFSAIFQIAIDAKQFGLRENPASEVPLKKVNNERTRFMDVAEEEHFRSVMLTQFAGRYCEYALARHTGARKSEMYGIHRKHLHQPPMQWENVNLERRTIFVPRSKDKGKPRILYINDSALQALQELRKRGDGSGPVLRDENGDTMTKPGRWWERALKVAKVRDFHWHDLRHTFASHLVLNGVDLYTVQELMGHSSGNDKMRMTKRYAHLSPAHLLAAVQRIKWEDRPLVVSTDTQAATSNRGSVQVIERRAVA